MNRQEKGVLALTDDTAFVSDVLSSDVEDITWVVGNSFIA